MVHCNFWNLLVKLLSFYNIIGKKCILTNNFISIIAHYVTCNYILDVIYFVFIVVVPLTVEVVPKINRVAAFQKSTLLFICQVWSSSVPYITWNVPQSVASTVSEDQFAISNTSHQIVDGKPMYSSVFTSKKILPHYTGQYTCSATTNEDGKKTKIGRLIVTSKPIIDKTEMIRSIILTVITAIHCS